MGFEKGALKATKCFKLFCTFTISWLTVKAIHKLKEFCEGDTADGEQASEIETENDEADIDNSASRCSCEGLPTFATNTPC